VSTKEISFQEIEIISNQVFRLWREKLKISKYHLDIPPNEQRLVANSQTAKEGIGILLYLALRQKDGVGVEHTFDVLDALSQQAYNYRYTGDWFVVQQMLETTKDLRDQIACLLRFKTKRDFFGNVLPFAFKMYFRVRWQKYPNQLTAKRGKQKVRRRGYDDKGHLRPKHQPPMEGIPQKEVIPRSDWRDRVDYFNRPPFFTRNSSAGLFPISASEGGERIDQIHRFEETIS